MSEIAAVVPAYNEEKTIGEVVSVLRRSGFFSEVIVVSDGSTDQTANVAREQGAMVYELSPNQGKGAAMCHGVSHTRAPLIFFCDADLIGLREEHLRILIHPLQEKRVGMCVGLRDRGRMMTWLTKILPLIGGERLLMRDIFEKIPANFLRGYRAELMMNAQCRKMNRRIERRALPGLHLRRKMQKVGFWKGLKGYICMLFQLIDAVMLTRKLKA